MITTSPEQVEEDVAVRVNGPLPIVTIQSTLARVAEALTVADAS